MRGNISLRIVLVFSVAMAILGLAAGTVLATDLTWDRLPGTVGPGDSTITGGAGTWDTTTGNWTADGGANNVAWDNTLNAGDTAVFTGTAGVVDLGSDITLNGMRIEVTGYKIGDSSGEANILNFGGTTPQITYSSAATNTYIYAGITGSPNLNIGLPDKNHSYLVPNVESMTLGHVTYTRLGSRLHLGGTTSGNSIASFSYTSYATIYADGSGTWTLGNISGPGQVELYLKSGNLIANGTIDISLLYFQIQGGVFHYNNAAAVAASKRMNMKGGNLDNSSGEAITSTNNHAMDWSGDFTFIGSNGAASDLNLGAGAVSLGTAAVATRTVTIQHPDTTLTVGGIISNGTHATTPTTALTKAGDGTLTLSGTNTYTGPTTVNEGTLLINGNQSAATGAVTVNDGGTLGGDGTIGGAVTVVGGGAVVWDFDGATGTTLDLLGDLQLDTNWKLTLTGTGAPSGEYDLFKYAGNFGGDLAGIIDTTGTGWATPTIGQDTTPGAGRIFLTLGARGDADGDGDVDAADYVMVKRNFGKPVSVAGEDGDFNGNGTVDWDDLQTLMSGLSSGGVDGAPIPEPATLGLLAFGAMAIIRRRRRLS